MEGVEKSLLGINSREIGLVSISHAVNPLQPCTAGLLEAWHLYRSWPRSKVQGREGGEGRGGLNRRTRRFCPRRPPPAPRVGDGEGSEEDSGREKLGTGWEPGELWLHSSAAILQVLVGRVPLVLVFLAIHTLYGAFPSGLSNPHMYFGAEERPWWLL